MMNTVQAVPHFSVLIIEDDPAMARSLKEALSSEHLISDWAATGSEGLQRALTHNPHLIILDVRLPDGSGFDVCRQMRQMALRQPILILTARNEEVDKVLGLEMGADDYLTKPFGMRELLSRVRALLRRAYGELAAGGERIYAGDLTIDLDRGKVLRGESEIALSPTEFRLLVYLARHPGQVLTRAQIIENVWGYGKLGSRHFSALDGGAGWQNANLGLCGAIGRASVWEAGVESCRSPGWPDRVGRDPPGRRGWVAGQPPLEPASDRLDRSYHAGRGRRPEGTRRCPAN
jgi:DNA-binding response OmpR family regulator